MPTQPYTSDGSDAAPRLAFFLNLASLMDLPDTNTAPRGDDRAVYTALRDAGFEGLQGCSYALATDVGLKHAASGRINRVGEIDEHAKRWKDEGAACSTLHVGWGMEDDATADALVDGVLEASARHGLPLYIETHRSTITQDNWRTVQLARRHPDLRFNGDFSHWYTGHEMAYAGVDTTLDFIAPVLDRVAFVHARIGNPGHIQTDAGRDLPHALTLPHVQHFVQLWTRAFAAFKKQAAPGDYLVFAPELLAPPSYARVFPGPDGQLIEETDRFQQSLLYLELAKHCFAAA